MRKRIALTALAMVPFSVSHANEAELVGIITAETLNVRSGPGSNFEVLYMVNKDDRVTITDTSNGWHKVKNNEDKEGWISSKYISISESSETVSRSSSYEQKEVNTNGLNMRSGASTSYRVITTLNKGTKVEVISESNGWSKIKYDGRLGYVYSIYLDDIKPSYTNTTTKTVNTNSLNVRSGPSTSNSIVGKLSKGTKVSVISESNGWSKILYNNKECYVSSRYLDSKSSSSDNSNNNSSNSTIKETKEVNTDSLNVRTGPSTSYSKLGTLSKGTKVGVISESNGWSKILYNNKEAYVSSQYLSKISSGSTDDNTSNTVKETKEVNTDSLNVRSGPSTSYSKLGTLSKGTKVGVISESNGWSKILYNNKEAYVSSQYLSKISSGSTDDNTSNTVKETKEVNTDSLNVRSGPSTSYSKLGTLSKGTKVGVISERNGWSKILYNDKEAYVSSQYLSEVGSESGDTGSGSTDVDTGAFGQGTVSDLLLSYTFEQHLSKQVSVSESGYNRANGSKATKLQIEEKLNPSKIISASSYGKLQFLRIDRYTDGITASELNKFLNSKVSSSNVFYNKGQQFIDAAKKYDIDVVYFVAHCMWETGYGSSTLAKGQTLTTYKGQALSKPVTVYNFFGIGAYDGTANLSGAETAYKYGWTSIDATIEGSAKWIAANYIKHSSYKQNTVYKMKWNYGSHQYATDINWCNGIASVMNSLIGYYDNQSKLVYERLVYK
ncbi:MAG: SH3 domain-containing protein [Peptostreptococcaceae bacterium]|nr:SH3 domain-containing protein [Peptostreptococcaceae bacterium]